jgi:uncharacterized membrane protein
MILWTALLSLLPISELRGGIPYALASGLPWYAAYPLCAALNMLVAPLCWLFLSTVHRLLYRPDRFAWYRSLFDRLVERSRRKLQAGVDKWGPLGIALFVAIPLPATGAWTGTLGAWVLGMSRWTTFLAVALGVAVSGAIVTAVCTLGIAALP